MKLTGTGKIMHRRAFGSHLLTKKSANRKRKIRKALVVQSPDTSRLRALLGE